MQETGKTNFEYANTGEFSIALQLVYDKCRFEVCNLQQNPEGREYGACQFILNGRRIHYRTSKITPTKTGQFVSIWKRSKEGLTEPFDMLDDFDFIIITARSKENLGQFIFPKAVLAAKGIITRDGKEGKRGIRVYPPWDKPTSIQAAKTQSWQANYFLTIKSDGSTDLKLAKKLLTEVSA